MAPSKGRGMGGSMQTNGSAVVPLGTAHSVAQADAKGIEGLDRLGEC